MRIHTNAEMPSAYIIHLLVPFAILVAGALAYSDSFNGPFVFDDTIAIENNLTIRELFHFSDVFAPPAASGTTVNGRPLLNLTFAINYWIGGVSVRGYHVVNLLIHLSATLALFGLCRCLLMTVWRNIDATNRVSIGAGSIAILWCLHPIHTQAVTYIVQRAESLVGLFMLLTIYLFCRARSSRRPTPWLMGSIAACLCGVGTKEVVVAAPLLVLLCDRAFYSETFHRAWLRSPVFYLLLFATWIPLAALIFAGGGRGGTVGFGVAGFSTWSYLLTQADALVRYLFLAIWPSKLVFDYGVGLSPGLSNVWLQGTFILTLLILTIIALVRLPRIAYLGAWFFLILAPSSSFVPIVTETMAEHRMYLPLASIFGFAVFGLMSLLGLRAAILVLLAVSIGCLSFRRNRDYETGEKLWSSSVRHYPQSARAHNNLGEIYAKRRQFELALTHIQEAIRIQPTYLDALCNWAGVLSQLGRANEAVILAEGLAKGHPNEATVQSTYGAVLYRCGRFDDAAFQFKRALELAPMDLDAHNNLGVYLYERNQLEEATRHFRAVLSITPNDGATLFNLGNVFVKTGEIEQAIEFLHRSIRAEPSRYEAYNNLGAIFAQRGQIAEATAQFARAVELAPDFPDALNNLGAMFERTGRLEASLLLFERAIKARPDYAMAKANLERVRAQLRAK